MRSIAGAAVACGAPWAVQALQDALAADAPRADLLAMALTRTGRLSLAPLAAGMPIDSDVEFWRCRFASQIAVEREAN